jgi:hypothetical protein
LNRFLEVRSGFVESIALRIGPGQFLHKRDISFRNLLKYCSELLFHDGNLLATQYNRPKIGNPIEGGLEVFDDFLGENVGIEEIVRLFQAFVAEPEGIEACRISVDEFAVGTRFSITVRLEQTWA